MFSIFVNTATRMLTQFMESGQLVHYNYNRRIAVIRYEGRYYEVNFHLGIRSCHEVHHHYVNGEHYFVPVINGAIWINQDPNRATENLFNIWLINTEMVELPTNAPSTWEAYANELRLYNEAVVLPIIRRHNEEPYARATEHYIA